jgi:hypothetical protein
MKNLMILVAVGPLAIMTDADAACKTSAECAQEAVEVAASTKATLELLLPKGVVMAFNLENCPSGWSEFSNGAGRTLMGMVPGDDSFRLGKTGGRADIPQGGEHNHAVQFGRNELNGRFGNDNADDDWSTAKAAGHNHGGVNLPPYVAVKFCELK